MRNGVKVVAECGQRDIYRVFDMSGVKILRRADVNQHNFVFKFLQVFVINGFDAFGEKIVCHGAEIVDDVFACRKRRRIGKFGIFKPGGMHSVLHSQSQNVNPFADVSSADCLCTENFAVGIKQQFKQQKFIVRHIG